ncbi:MAG TPA: hypothetical protein VL997_08795 [Dyella sp.]|nr:hypothetical protein [Dyella sp.]
MGKGMLGNRWVQQLAVALGYALVYAVVARMFSDAPWPFTASLRAMCLLVIPYRYWLALAIGETGPLIYNNLESIDRFGLTYAVMNAIPRIAVGMPVAWWFLSRGALFPARHQVDVKRLLWCVLTLSVLWALLNYVTASMARSHTGPYRMPEGTFFLFLCNFYLATLVVVPWVVMARVNERKEWRRLPRFKVLVASALVQDAAMAMLALLALAFLYHVVNDAMKLGAMMALFLPAGWLVLKHGWNSAALGALSLIPMCALLEWSWRAGLGMPSAQMFMAIAMTCIYAFGARISAQLQQCRKLELGAKEAQAAAQRALATGEHRLRQTSQALECMAGVLQMDHAHVLENFVPNAEKDEYSQQSLHLQRHVYRLAESIHPSAWRERGLGAALYENIGLALREAGMTYRCDLPGRDLNFLSGILQTAVYRFACEAVARAAVSPACLGVHLAIRMGRYRGIQGVVLRIDHTEDATNVAHATLHAQERRYVAPKLGASMKSVDELRRLANVFDGLLHYRILTSGARMSVLLCDTHSQAPRQREDKVPLRLWVSA